MSNAADVITPPGATHVMWSYGDPHYFRKTLTPHLNQVSEEWQSRTTWHEWDFKTRAWCPAGAGFSDRRLKELKREITSPSKLASAPVSPRRLNP